ncbi:Outer membrane porin F [bacterium HR40]|nr:Outer membrane porin F [bacterium HR40]
MSAKPCSRDILAVLLVASLLPVPTALGGEVYLFRGQAPSASELADLMFPGQGQKTRNLRTRGIRFVDPSTEGPAPAAPPPAKLGAPAPPPQQPPASTTAAAPATTDVPATEGASVGFNINFALGSAALLPDSLPYLDAVGRMLREERPEVAIEVAGHADASGADQINQQLSEQRALAVARYLYERWGISPERMRIVGYGESQPLPGTDPYDGVNRRVEFRPLP